MVNLNTVLNHRSKCILHSWWTVYLKVLAFSLVAALLNRMLSNVGKLARSTKMKTMAIAKHQQINIVEVYYLG